MMRWIAVCCFAGVALAEPSSVRSDERLCFVGGECVAFSCGAKVASSDQLRHFVLVHPERREYYFGTLRPGDVTPRCAGQAFVSVGLAKRSAVPALVRITIANEEGERWTESVSGSALTASLKLGTANSGKHVITLEASGIIRWTTTVETGDVPRQVVADLKPVPKLHGRVVDARTGDAIPGAVLATDVDTGAVSDPAGSFSIEADPDRWPKTINVSSPGYAETSITVPGARASTALDPVRLTRGGSIVAELLQKEPAQVVELELLRLVNNGRSLGRLAGSLPVPGKDPTLKLRFDNVEPGDYILLAKGREPWERLGEVVRVETDEESKLVLLIDPFELSIRVRQSGAPAPNAHVVLRNRDLFWNAEVPTDAEGEVTLALWQGGRLEGTVLAKGFVPYIDRREIRSEDREWRIELAAQEVFGTVVDGNTGDVVSDAALMLSMKSEEGYKLNVKAQADKNGAFRISPVVYGSHLLRAAARGYSPVDLPFDFHAPEQHRNLTVKLKRGTTAAIRVVDERGIPLAGAQVFDFAGLSRRGSAHTDTSGLAELMIPEGENRTVFVVPRDGSLGATTVTGGNKERTVIVKSGLCRIVLMTQATSKEPIPNISTVVRFDGFVLPVEVLTALATLQGARVRSDDSGRIVFDHMPAGTYEFWPVGSVEELAALSAGAGPRAPVTIAATPGENVATLTFSRVQP